MVLSVQSWVTAEGVGGCLERATVRVDRAADHRHSRATEGCND